MVVEFLHFNIICSFGIPKCIITDNASKLNSHLMKEVCEQFKIAHHHSTPYLPKENGAVEAVNKNIKKILRKMVQGSRQWHEKLPFAILGYRTTIPTSTSATPYLLFYGTEAVIPAEVEIPSLRIIVEAEIDDTKRVKSRLEQLSLIDEKRLTVVFFGQLYQQRMGELTIRSFNNNATLGEKVLQKPLLLLGVWLFVVSVLRFGWIAASSYVNHMDIFVCIVLHVVGLLCFTFLIVNEENWEESLRERIEYNLRERERMGNCLSHVKGGKQAVGGVGHHMDPAGAAGGGDGAAVGQPNDVVDLFYRKKGLNALYIPIELSLSALKLRDLDIISKSDPTAVVSLRQRDGTLEDLGRTEVIMNNLDPVWVHFCCTNLWSRTVPCTA
ncbi:Protein BONZAI 3 [Capsicum chinense]|nr:Protein BONZAI 3 [Capsicum chinense]